MPPEAFFWLLVILLLVIAGFIGVTFLRRYLNSADTGQAGQAFTLGDLRNLVKQGKLSQQEYENLRQQIVAAAKKDAPDPLARDKRPPADPNEPPAT